MTGITLNNGFRASVGFDPPAEAGRHFDPELVEEFLDMVVDA